MKTKTNKLFMKTAVAFMIVLFAVIFAGKSDIQAKSGNVVRVSTQKQLNAAMKNSDVETIIFRTEVYGSFTIKRVKAAKEKTLILDTPNAAVHNKAVFAEINILSAGNYFETVSGNKIVIIYDSESGSFHVEKGKKVKSLEIRSNDGYIYCGYDVKEGAKIKEIKYVYTGNNAQEESTYNKSKRTLSLEFTDPDSCTRSFTLKFDKSGRVTSATCESNWVEYCCDYKFTYDSNGNVIKITGKDNDNGKFTNTLSYSNDLLQKKVYKGEFSSGETVYSYNKEGDCIKEEYTGVDQMDGQTFDVKYSYEYDYDEKGHHIYERQDDLILDTFYEYRYFYNKKEFLTKTIGNESGLTSVYIFKYNKAGDLIEESETKEGNTETITYEYDELGYPKN